MRLGGKSSGSALSDAFTQCINCKKTLFKRELEANLLVCPHCSHHHRLTARQRITWTFDPDSFEERDQELQSLDTLSFPEYGDKLGSAIQKNGRNDGILSGFAALDGRKVSIAVADFSFMGGSMGSVAGEKVTRTLERGCESRVPAIVFCASGGARMQEGLLSLMQMAKTNAALTRLAKKGLPYISVLTDPTMGGVSAGFAFVGDVVIAEPKALIGFAGARVSKQAQVVKAPDDFQTAEYHLKHGMIDRIVPRRDLRDALIALTSTLGGQLESA